MTQIVPVIMCGGAGSRLWPVSRQERPKQLLALVTEKTLLQETALRALPGRGLDFTPPLIVSNEAQADTIQAQLKALDLTCSALVIEPFGRNTAAVAALAGELVSGQFADDTLILLMPADHHVRDVDAFRHAVEMGVPAAEQGRLVTLGISPTGPETGYGYIQSGERRNGEAFDVLQFREKPDRQTAAALLRDGGWYWNAGLFLFKASTVMEEMARLCPAVLDPALRALHNGERHGAVHTLAEADFAQVEDLPFDIAVMEKTDKAAVVPVDCGWDDVGSFSALWEIGEKDADNNVYLGAHEAALINSHGNFISSDGPMVTAVGIDDLVIIATKDAIMVTRREQSQDVKKIVESLKTKNFQRLL